MTAHLHNVLLAVIAEVGCAHHVHLAPVLRHQLGHCAWQVGPLSPPLQLHLQEQVESVHVGCKDSKAQLGGAARTGGWVPQGLCVLGLLGARWGLCHTVEARRAREARTPQ